MTEPPVGQAGEAVQIRTLPWSRIRSSSISFLAAVGITCWVLATLFPASSKIEPYFLYAALLAFSALVAITAIWDKGSSEGAEESALERLRSAEEKLASRTVVAESSTERESSSGRSDGLALVELWNLTQLRLNVYHEIATKQAKRSFTAAQIAIVIGFILLAIFAAFAIHAKSSVGAITAGGLGAASAALAGYIGRTFIRSQEAAAHHLRAYFDQPLEFSRYLAVERFLADQHELSPSQRAEIIAEVVRGMIAHEVSENRGYNGRAASEVKGSEHEA